MGQYSKAIIAIITAALIAAASALPDYANVIQVALALLGAFAVFIKANDDAPEEP